MLGFHRKRQSKLQDEMVSAIFSDSAADVRRLLDSGVDANALLTDRERGLDLAMLYADSDVIDLLLRAGADIRSPYVWAGAEFRLSEAATLCGRPESVVQRLREAEQESAAKDGPLPRLYRPSRSCARPSPAV